MEKEQQNETKNAVRVICISDAEPDDVLAVGTLLAACVNHGVPSSNILIVGCGRDPRDAQTILQRISNLFYSDLIVAQGAASKNKPFADPKQVFLNTELVREIRNTATERMDIFAAKGPFTIVNLSTFADLSLMKKSSNCARIFVSGGANATGEPSFNLRSDPAATKAMLSQWSKSGPEIIFFSPVLYATSMARNISCNEDTCPSLIKTLNTSETEFAKLARAWIANWDEQLAINSPEFAKKIPHLGNQFTPADLFVVSEWIAVTFEGESDQVSVPVTMEMMPFENPKAGQEDWFSLKTKRDVFSCLHDVMWVNITSLCKRVVEALTFGAD